MRGGDRAEHQVVQPGGRRLNSCCADLLTEFTHACVLNTRSECEVGCARACVCVCVCGRHASVSVRVCLSSWLLWAGLWALWKEAPIWPGCCSGAGEGWTNGFPRSLLFTPAHTQTSPFLFSQTCSPPKLKPLPLCS